MSVRVLVVLALVLSNCGPVEPHPCAKWCDVERDKVPAACAAWITQSTAYVCGYPR